MLSYSMSKHYLMNTTKVNVKGMSEFFDEQSPVIKAALPDTYI